MPVILAALGILATVVFFVMRARNAAHMAGELADMANDVRLAARRFGFRRQTNVHPVETIEDPALAAGAIATAFLEMDDLPTKDQRSALQGALRDSLELDAGAAEEMTILGHWFVSECGGPDPAITRLTRKLVKLGGQDLFQPLLEILNTTAAAGSGGLNTRQREALEEIRRAFRIG